MGYSVAIYDMWNVTGGRTGEPFWLNHFWAKSKRSKVRKLQKCTMSDTYLFLLDSAFIKLPKSWAEMLINILLK